MVSRRLLAAATIICLLVGGLGLTIFVQQRIAACAAVPLLAEQLLPNADLAQPGDPPSLPQGWGAAAPGVQLGAFALDGDRRSLQLIGIANYVQTPTIAVQPERSYCFTGFAITDSVLGSPTRVQLSFHWRDAAGNALAVDQSPWLPVRLWRADAPPAGWSPLQATFRAPAAAAELNVRIAPASDDRIYLDVMALRQAGTPAPRPAPPSADLPQLRPWPDAKRAAVAFTFDWETTMGGLIHSRSLGDPNFDDDPVVRGMRMRTGITTTLEIFRPHDIRATYYATGYNFLPGNTARATFMENPIYAWASTENRWTSDRWTTTPWFADDPYGTVQSHPAWYFADLLPLLQAAQQDIQSHTFSHFYGGFVDAREWTLDLDEWARVAALQQVPPASSLAFPWSGSGGMSDANWQLLAERGIRSVTRLSDQSQYNLFPRDEAGLIREPQCRTLPGHPRILACPDFYLTPAGLEPARAQLERAIAAGGMIDFWAHTEEVTSPEQIAAWREMVDYVANHDELWVAPLSEIAARRQAVAQVELTLLPAAEGELRFVLHNHSELDLPGLTLALPFVPERLSINDDELSANMPLVGRDLLLEVAAGRSMEVRLWPVP
jgi:hypothetical protein